MPPITPTSAPPIQSLALGQLNPSHKAPPQAAPRPTPSGGAEGRKLQRSKDNLTAMKLRNSFNAGPAKAPDEAKKQDKDLSQDLIEAMQKLLELQQQTNKIAIAAI